MTGEINFFRKRFFGGFNRNDVVAYIERMAQERNMLEDSKNKSESEVQALTDMNATLYKELQDTKEKAEIIAQSLTDDNASLRKEIAETNESAQKAAGAHAEEIASLHRETEETKRLMRESNNRMTAVFEAAERTLAEFETTIGSINSEVQVKMSSAMSELKSTGDSIEKLPSTLAQVIERINELRTAFNNG